MDSAIGTPSMGPTVLSGGRLNVKGMAEICAGEAKCGNGFLDAGEDCDSSAEITQLSCTESPFSFLFGTVSCSSFCTYDTSGCSNQTPSPTNSPTMSPVPTSSSKPTSNYGLVNFDFGTGDYGFAGWTIEGGTWTVGSDAGVSFIRSSNGVDSKCDQFRSPSIVMTATSTVTLSTFYDIEEKSRGSTWDRANIALYINNLPRTIIKPDGGRFYDLDNGKSDGVFQCPVEVENFGWAGIATSWAESSFSAAALGLNIASDETAEVKLDAFYATDQNTAGSEYHVSFFPSVQYCSLLFVS